MKETHFAAMLIAGLLCFDVSGITAHNAYVSVNSSTDGVEDIVSVGADFYVTTRNVSAPSFQGKIGVNAKPPYCLIEPSNGQMVLGIGEKSEYRAEDESGLEDRVSGMVHVLKLDIDPVETNLSWNSTSCTLKLTDDSFPGGTAVWTSVPDGIDGSGNSITFNPNILTPGEYKVTAKSGIVSSYIDTCIVRIVKVETETVSLYPTDRSRRIVGVGEFVICKIVPASLSANWHSTSGVMSLEYGNSSIWEAPYNSTSARIVAEVINGPKCNVEFTVLAPTGVVSPDIPSTISYNQNVAGSGMIIKLWLTPLHVSFSRVEIIEIGAVSTNATGYFADTNLWPTANLNHSGNGADKWVSVGDSNFIGTDFVSCSYCPRPWSQGFFTWPIPAAWRIAGDSSTNSLPWSDQDFSIDQFGTVTVSKFHHSATRSTNDVYSTIY